MFPAAHSAAPWLAGWNRAILEWLFALVPHTPFRDTLAQYLVENPLVSTWVYAAAFYIFWQMDDAHTAWRRKQLFETAAACVLMVAVTLGIRPWIGWAAPARTASFQDLYPPYLWGTGTGNSLPSHSTLVYFLVAVGLWRLKRWVGALLAALVLAAIALPRTYIGGHYPIDVVASIVLVFVGLGVVRWCCARAPFSSWRERALSASLLTQLFLFLWLFELAEGFRSATAILSAILHVRRFL